MLEFVENDGVLSITETRECQHYVVYDNYLGAGPGDQSYTLESGAVVEVIKGGFDIPEILRVTAYGVKYETRIEEWKKGEVCVPWQLIG